MPFVSGDETFYHSQPVSSQISFMIFGLTALLLFLNGSTMLNSNGTTYFSHTCLVQVCAQETFFKNKENTSQKLLNLNVV